MSRILCISGLPQGVSENGVYELCSRAGPVESVDLLANRGEAHVTFSMPMDLDSVVESLQGAKNTAIHPGSLSFTFANESAYSTNHAESAHGDKNISAVKTHSTSQCSGNGAWKSSPPAYSSEKEGGGAVARPFSASYASAQTNRASRDALKVCVSRLSPGTTEEELRGLFIPAIAGLGEINDLFLDMRRNYAFVGFSTASAVEAALRKSGSLLKGYTVTVERKRLLNRSNRVSVHGLPSDCTEEALRLFFSSCGNISDLYLDPVKGFGFVNFTTPEAVEEAIAKSGMELGGCALTILHRKFKTCFTCSQEGHVAAKCPNRKDMGDSMCHKCGRYGHLTRDCRRRSPPGRWEPDSRQRRKENTYSDRRDNGDEYGYHRRRRSRSRSRSRDRDRDHDRHRHRHHHRDRDRDRDRRDSRSPPLYRNRRHRSRSHSPGRQHSSY